MSRPTVGIVGLGRMGSSFAECLIGTGFEVEGHDVAPAAREPGDQIGVTIQKDPAAVASAADVAITSLPKPVIVEDVYLGEEGVLVGACHETSHHALITTQVRC